MASAAVALALALGVAPHEARAVTSCASASAEPAQASRAAATRATLCLINAERSARGLGAVRLDRKLSRAARRHSRHMVRRGYFAHTTPRGSSFVQRIRRAGYLRPGRWWYLGEDLAWGVGSRGSPQGVVRAWMHSPKHREVMLTPLFREVGIGLVWGAPRGLDLPAATYTADFGFTN